MSLGSNVVDLVHSLQENPTRLHCLNVCINSTGFALFCNKVRPVSKWCETPQNMSLGSNGMDWMRSLWKIPTHQFALFCTEVRAVMKRSEMLQNRSLGSNGVDHVCLLWKILTRLGCANLCINCTSLAHCAPKFVSNRTIPNAPKHEFGVQWRGLGAFCCKKFWCDIVARTCALMTTVQLILHRSLCINEMARNTPKYEIGVQWGVSGAFDAKKSNATLLHELMH
jgi:hypothetical protein